MKHRLLRVKELIRRELGTILERNYTFNGSLVTIHTVDVTPDFKQCFIYAGVMGGTTPPQEVIYKLNDLRPQIQRELFKRVILKYSPTLLFRYDNSVERGVKILHAIDTLPPAIPEEDPVDHEALDAEEDAKTDDGGKRRRRSL